MAQEPTGPKTLMDIESLFQASRWELLIELARKAQGTTEIATRLRTSPANVSQQLRQLELAGLVAKRRSSKGRTHYKYFIPKSYTYAVSLTPNSAHKGYYKRSIYENFLVGISLHLHCEALLAFIIGRPEIMGKAQFIGVLKRGSPELFIITEDVDNIRHHHANVEVSTTKGPRRVVVWSHTLEEINEGLTKKEQYFENLVKESELMHDPEEIYLGLIEKMEEQ